MIKIICPDYTYNLNINKLSTIDVFRTMFSLDNNIPDSINLDIDIYPIAWLLEPDQYDDFDKVIHHPDLDFIPDDQLYSKIVEQLKDIEYPYDMLCDSLKYQLLLSKVNGSSSFNDIMMKIIGMHHVIDIHHAINTDMKYDQHILHKLIPTLLDKEVLYKRDQTYWSHCNGSNIEMKDDNYIIDYRIMNNRITHRFVRSPKLWINQILGLYNYITTEQIFSRYNQDYFVNRITSSVGQKQRRIEIYHRSGKLVWMAKGNDKFVFMVKEYHDQGYYIYNSDELSKVRNYENGICVGMVDKQVLKWKAVNLIDVPELKC